MILHVKKSLLLAAIAAIGIPQFVLAGNEDRIGSAGAQELLINSWARSSGWANANVANCRGIESMFNNIAGIAFTKKTEVSFSHTQWLKGSGININTFGFSQKAGDASVIGLSVVSFDFGDIEKTTAEQPEGGLGTFSPQLLNISASYAKIFSNSIYGGVNVKIISESIGDVDAQGLALDAGIQYVTGFNEAKDNLKFGISLKNVGAPMKFEGDGLATKGTPLVGGTQMTLETRSDKFEMPSLVNIGASYDFQFQELHRISLAATFTSNSFSHDQTSLGLEYSFKKIFAIRGGYMYEKKDEDLDISTNVLTGFAGGLSIDVPLGKGGKTFCIDYSYRATDPFDGTHCFGARFNL